MPHTISTPDAAKVLAQAKRVLVIGTSGGGKTTLALKIAQEFGLEYQSLDRDVRWLAGWQARDRAAQRTIIKELVSRPAWVMDGSSPSSFDLRVPPADLIIWVRPHRLRAMWGLAKRVCRNYGTVRPAMAKGCPEPLPDRKFLNYIWHFERVSAPKFVTQIDTYGPQTPLVLIPSHDHGAQLLRTS